MDIEYKYKLMVIGWKESDCFVCLLWWRLLYDNMYIWFFIRVFIVIKVYIEFYLFYVIVELNGVVFIGKFGFVGELNFGSLVR